MRICRRKRRTKQDQPRETLYRIIEYNLIRMIYCQLLRFQSQRESKNVKKVTEKKRDQNWLLRMGILTESSIIATFYSIYNPVTMHLCSLTSSEVSILNKSSWSQFSVTSFQRPSLWTHSSQVLEPRSFCYIPKEQKARKETFYNSVFLTQALCGHRIFGWSTHFRHSQTIPFSLPECWGKK